MPSARRHYRLRWPDAIAAHETALQRGGVPGFIDAGLVKSAIERPYNGHYRPIRKKMAALVQSLCGNHGFTDGNKRTCMILMLLFLERSGYTLEPISGEDLDEAIEQMTLDVADGRMGYAQIERWASQRLRKKPAR